MVPALKRRGGRRTATCTTVLADTLDRMREDKRANALMRIAEAKEKQCKKRMLAQGMSRVKAKRAREN